MIVRTKWIRQKLHPITTQIYLSSVSSRGLKSTSDPSQVGTEDVLNHNNELFEYTSGRWIFNENIRLAERSLSFNIDELKKAAARSLNKPVTDVKSLRKMAEGGFNRIFEISMGDGTSVLARLPYPSTLPRRLAVASEVATIDLVRAHGIPAPKILGYDIDENPVGSEYILMEKLPGRPIGDAWFNLSEQQRLQILHDVVKLESKLFDIEIPASGSIYYNHDLEPNIPKVSMPGLEDRFCMGPYSGLRWWFKEREHLEIDRGPHAHTLRVLEAPVKKELAWIRKHGRPRFPFHRQQREAFQYKKQDPTIHAESLAKYLRVAPHLAPENPELNVPVLRHPDLQPNNIFIDDDCKVIGVIDWQHAIALPKFLAAGIPDLFQNHSDPESRSFTLPQPPTHLDSLDEFERAHVEEKFRRRHVHFFYWAFTQRLNQPHWRALLEEDADILKRRIFDHAGEPWEGCNSSLQYDLLEISQNWNKVAPVFHDGTTAPCPISFTQEEAGRIEALDDSCRDADRDVERINRFLSVGSDGWTSTENYLGAMSKAAEIREQALASVDDDPWLREMSERHWPFDDFDEDE